MFRFAQHDSAVLLLGFLRRRKPAGDFKFAAHHCGIAAVDGEIYTFEHDERLRPLHIVKEMHQRRPRAFRFNGSEHGLMVRRSFAGPDRGRLIRWYQAGIILVFPPIGIAHDCLAKSAAQACQTERRPAPGFS